MSIGNLLRKGTLRKIVLCQSREQIWTIQTGALYDYLGKTVAIRSDASPELASNVQTGVDCAKIELWIIGLNWLTPKHVCPRN